jgi:hypothetical protein
VRELAGAPAFRIQTHDAISRIGAQLNVTFCDSAHGQRARSRRSVADFGSPIEL